MFSTKNPESSTWSGANCWRARLRRGLALTFLSSLAVVLIFPMVWMVICAFAPAAELQTEVPMGRAVAALWRGGSTENGPSGVADWAGAYLTTENFVKGDGRSGLFEVTRMPARDFWAAPMHRPIAAIIESTTGQHPAQSAAASAPPPIVIAGRLILWFENTLLIAGLVTLLSVMVNAAAAHAFARLRVPGGGMLFAVMLATIMVPGQVTLLPLFLLCTQGLGWHNSYWAVILPQVAAPVGIFMMRQYMMGLPRALEDAARIDGCSEPAVFWRVTMPLAKPVVAVWAVLTFIGAWKAFLWPLVILDNQNMQMLEVGLKTLQFSAGPRNIGVVMAAALLASVPMVLAFALFQRHLTAGLTVGGMKG